MTGLGMCANLRLPAADAKEKGVKHITSSLRVSPDLPGAQREMSQRFTFHPDHS